MKIRLLYPLIIVSAIVSLVVSPAVLALDPPPGGGYPNNNTALGTDALFSITTVYPSDNTAIGFQALYNDTSVGSSNTAVGSNALFGNTTGNVNVAVGWAAMTGNTTGSENVAVGPDTLLSNTTGEANVAVGNFSLFFNKVGFGNVAIGNLAGGGIDGDDNVALGDRAMAGEVIGATLNTAVGYAALFDCTGEANIGIGRVAGAKLSAGSHNIDIGNQGVANENRTIRIGNIRTQRRAFMAGVSGVTVADGVSVVINSEGQLGVATSSARYKENIQPMEKASEAILSLQPVTFRYRKDLDPEAIAQFGLVAEEVAKVSPDLVARDEEGKPYTVRYEAVNAMLLNEFLKEHRKVEEQTRINQQQERALAKQAQQIEELTGLLREQEARLERISAQVQSAPPTPRLAGN